MKSFFKKHWKKLLLVVLIVVVVILAIVFIPKLLGNKTQTAGVTGILTVDGNAVGIFEEKDEASKNAYTVEAKTTVIEVNSSKNTVLSAKKNAFPFPVNSPKKGMYEIDLTGLPHESIVEVKIQLGGDGTFVNRQLTNEVDCYYLCLKIDSGNTTDGEENATANNAPSGTISFNGEKFKTFYSESAAQQAVEGENFVIPKGMASNLTITAEPTEGTARIWAWVCMANGEDVYDDGQQARMNADSEWSATFDVSAYAGQQIVICLKSEDGMSLNCGYSYVSFMIPE